MARWDELILHLVGIVENAQDYLTVRKSQVQDAAELERIDDWSKRLLDRLTAIQQINVQYQGTPAEAAVAPDDKPTYIILSEQLDLTGQQLQQLHDWYPYEKVEQVMMALEQYLGNFMAAGPHGPGGGRPGGV